MLGCLIYTCFWNIYPVCHSYICLNIAEIEEWKRKIMDLQVFLQIMFRLIGRRTLITKRYTPNYNSITAGKHIVNIQGQHAVIMKTVHSIDHMLKVHHCQMHMLTNIKRKMTIFLLLDINTTLPNTSDS